MQVKIVYIIVNIEFKFLFIVLYFCISIPNLLRRERLFY